MSYRLILTCFALLAIALTGSTIVQSQSSANSIDKNSADIQHVVMRTSLGDVTIELDAENAPASVNNFLEYVDADFYTDTLFHRVIEGFMIQGGGFTPTYQQKKTRPPISNEAYNGLKNRKYTIAMARTTAPHSATSQFFINTENNRNLDHTATTPRGWGYTVFGRVIEGQEVVDKISRVKTGAGGKFRKDVPATPIIIQGLERLEISMLPDPAENNISDTAEQKAEGAAATSTAVQ